MLEFLLGATILFGVFSALAAFAVIVEWLGERR